MGITNSIAIIWDEVFVLSDIYANFCVDYTLELKFKKK